MRAADVSVVIPCYNLGRYLPEAVASVLAQTVPPAEIVIVDDASDDAETRALLDAPPWPGVRVVRAPVNRGPSAARNLGLRETTAPFLSFLDADDRLRPAWLEQARRAFDENPGITFVNHWVQGFGDSDVPLQPERCDLPTLLDHCAINGGAMLRRAALEEVGGWDESMRGWEDWELWIRLLGKGHRGIVLPEHHYEYRKRPGSVSREAEDTGRRQELWRTIVTRHREAYAPYLADLLLVREATAVELAGSIRAMDDEIHGGLALTIHDRRQELAALEQETRREPAGEAARFAHEVRALRASWSWRVTAPLRRAYELLGLARNPR